MQSCIEHKKFCSYCLLPITDNLDELDVHPDCREAIIQYNAKTPFFSQKGIVFITKELKIRNHVIFSYSYARFMHIHYFDDHCEMKIETIYQALKRMVLEGKNND
jgi:hypothetical protein